MAAAHIREEEPDIIGHRFVIQRNRDDLVQFQDWPVRPVQNMDLALVIADRVPDNRRMLVMPRNLGQEISLIKGQVVDHHIGCIGIECGVELGIDEIDHLPRLNPIQFDKGIFKHKFFISDRTGRGKAEITDSGKVSPVILVISLFSVWPCGRLWVAIMGLNLYEIYSPLS